MIQVTSKREQEWAAEVARLLPETLDMSYTIPLSPSSGKAYRMNLLDLVSNRGGFRSKVERGHTSTKHVWYTSRQAVNFRMVIWV